ncbi:MAG: amidase, partial [Planctomycetota bacterium]|nr:amidase [Planctomycetota bacterium]
MDHERTPDQSIEDVLQRVEAAFEAREGLVHAFVEEPGRFERLRREARDLERRFPEDSVRPPLFGLAVGVKDIINVEGLPTRAGTSLPPELFAGPEAPCVRRLREAGALVVGKTVTTEFAYLAPGPTRNPHDPDHTPGGSSSGSAAGVAAGLCDAALGTQTVGSLMRPAAFCGVHAMKPSKGRVPDAG